MKPKPKIQQYANRRRRLTRRISEVNANIALEKIMAAESSREPALEDYNRQLHRLKVRQQKLA